MNLSLSQTAFVYALAEPDLHGFHEVYIDADRPPSWFRWVDLKLFVNLGWVEYCHGGQNPYFPDARVWVTVWLTDMGYREVMALLSPVEQDVPTEKDGEVTHLGFDMSELDEWDFRLLQYCTMREPLSALALSKLFRKDRDNWDRRKIAQRMESLEAIGLVEKVGPKRGWQLTSFGLSKRKVLAELYA